MEDTNAADMLHRAGFRATKQRVALVEYLSHAKRPMPVRRIARDLTGIDHVTVYRMLHALKEAGLVREINLRGEVPSYELHDEHDHHHIVCTDCGRIEDFTDETHERVERSALAKSRNFRKITGHSFDLYGVCKSCVK